MLITVEGRHSVELPAELGTLHLEVHCTDEDRARAMQTAQRSATRLVDELMGQAPVERHDVEAPRTWTEQRFDAQGQPAGIVHHAGIMMQVVFRDAVALSGFSARWGEQPDVQLGHVAWDLTEQTRRRHEDETLAAAITDARRRAAVMAAAAGAGEPTLVELSDPGLLGVGAAVHARLEA